METVKKLLKICNSENFFDYTNVGITCELNQVCQCIINSFYTRIPDSRIRVSLSIIDDIFSKITNNDIENIIENIHDLGKKTIHVGI